MRIAKEHGNDGHGLPVSCDCYENAQMDVDALEKTMAHLKVKLLLVLLRQQVQPMLVSIEENSWNHNEIWFMDAPAWGGALILSNDYRAMLDSCLTRLLSTSISIISKALCVLVKRWSELSFYALRSLNSAYDEEHGVPNLVSKSRLVVLMHWNCGWQLNH